MPQYLLTFLSSNSSVIIWQCRYTFIREAHTGTAGKSHGRRKKGLKDSYLQYTKRGDALQTSNAEDESEEMEEKASKGASKRRALRAKDWGAKLASLSANQLRQAVRLNFAQHLKSPWIKVWNHWGSLEVNNAVTLIMVNSVGRCTSVTYPGQLYSAAYGMHHHTRQCSATLATLVIMPLWYTTSFP